MKSYSERNFIMVLDKAATYMSASLDINVAVTMPMTMLVLVPVIVSMVVFLCM